MSSFRRFVVLWISTCLALWVVDHLFDALRFDSVESLLASGLVLALVNVTIKPVLVLITLPFTIFSFGLALPLINGLVLLGVAALVPGFVISGFWMGVVCALAVSLVSFLMAVATGQTRLQGAVILGGRARDSGVQVDSQDSNVIDIEATEKPSKNNRLG